MKKVTKERIFEVMQRLDKTFKPKLNENFGEESEEFVPHGTYTISNTGGYEIMLNSAGDAAKVRDAFGSDNPQTSDWLEIEYMPDEETGESEPVIDPNGYNIPLNQVMRLQTESVIQEQQTRPLHQIAQEIYRDWRPVHPHAKPYLEAMSTLSSINDNYMMDSGRSIVAYFLSNAGQWKGETAKRIKKELKKMLGLRENEELDERWGRKSYSTYGQRNDPRIITLRYDATCKETGERIEAGQQAVYYPSDKSFFGLDTKQAEDFRNWKADMDMGYDY